MPEIAEQIDSVESVSDVAGQRVFVIGANNGQLYRLPEDRLRWVWRLVFTSLAWRKQVRLTYGFRARAPVSLVIAQKASGVRVSCARCGRPHSAELFRTLQDEVEDVYFTRCRRCWRSQFLGRLSRVHAEPTPPSGPLVNGWPAFNLSTKAKVLLILVLVVVIAGIALLLNLHHSTGYLHNFGNYP